MLSVIDCRLLVSCIRVCESGFGVVFKVLGFVDRNPYLFLCVFVFF